MRFFAVSLFATLLSAPAFAADLGTYRPGTPYNSSVAAGADVCDNQCAGDAQCRGWNYVRPNPQAPGICEYLSSVSTPIPSQISISGENMSAAPFSSRVTAGGTNTIRVGTQAAMSTNTVAVGQALSTRRVVRQAVPQRVTTQSASTQPVENMSLTAQQNRFRQGAASSPQATPRRANRQAMPSQNPSQNHMQRPAFRPILDAPMAARGAQQPQATQPRQVKPQQGRPQRQAERRMTGPRRMAPAQYPAHAPMPPQPQSQPQYQGPNTQQAPYAQNQMTARGSSRPPVGQPIPAPQQAARPQRSTPSQRLAQFTAQTQASATAVVSNGPAALSPEQARQSLFGSLNDDLKAAPSAMPTVSSVPTAPVSEQQLGAVLAGGL